MPIPLGAQMLDALLGNLTGDARQALTLRVTLSILVGADPLVITTTFMDAGLTGLSTQYSPVLGSRRMCSQRVLTSVGRGMALNLGRDHEREEHDQPYREWRQEAQQASLAELARGPLLAGAELLLA